MRVKSDDRRQAILDVATALFREVGYERASMATISARVGGSKATLYNYFKSKEELFATAMMEAVEARGQEVIDQLDPAAGDLRAMLLRFGEAYLGLVTATDALAITRAAVAEGTHSELGPLLYQRGPQRGLREMAAFLHKMQARGEIRMAPVEIVAAHLKGLLEAGMIEPLLYGAPAEFDRKPAVAAAVDAFLCAYGVRIA